MQVRRHITAVLSVLLLFESFGINEIRAEESLSTQIDAMRAAYDRPNSLGCSSGIIHDAEPIYSKGFGLANLEHEVLNTPHTILETGSFAKSITCACIAILFDQGSISPDDDIRLYVPELQ